MHCMLNLTTYIITKYPKLQKKISKSSVLMSKQNFQQNIKQISPNLNAYIRPSKTPGYACIILHEHLGLVQNIVQTTQYLLGPQITIVIPDLFLCVTSKTLLNNQFDAIKKLKISRIIDAVMICVRELRKSHGKILLMGFSIGSAYAWKVLEKVSDFQVAFLFYGTPSTKSWNVGNIKTKVVAFSASDDKVKYLSDYNTYQQFSKRCRSNPLIKFQQINGVGHGFINPESPNFSQKAVIQCQKIMFTYLPSNLIPASDGNKSEEEGKKKDDCLIF